MCKSYMLAGGAVIALPRADGSADVVSPRLAAAENGEVS